MKFEMKTVEKIQFLSDSQPETQKYLIYHS